ncbi:hypothetical protein [uncultured Thalassospira sp.]|uniref:hypothetical protein n=1 Tax=uncultured Thalassospira sp. TaxID=404382 RepID=UPI0030DD8E14|tara:strand:+ start:189 stop:818 length:630 start_codon:yes stop_codon:yes gene_type:complete
MDIIQIPQNLYDYFNNSVIESAVEHILGMKSTRVPPNIDWTDLKDFYRANLYTQQIQCEFAEFMFDLWETIWRPHIKEILADGFLTELTLSENQEIICNYKQTQLWEYSDFRKKFHVKNEKDISITFAVSVQSIPKIQSGIKIERKNKNITHELFLNEDHWPKLNIEDGLYWSITDVTHPEKEKKINIDKLKKITRDALEKFENLINRN